MNNDPVSDTWETRAAAAEALSAILQERVSVNTLGGWLKSDGCPLPKGRGKIAKEPLIEWALTLRRGRSRPAAGANASRSSGLKEKLLREQIRYLRGKVKIQAGKSLDAAETYTVMARAAAELKRSLSEELIPKTWEMGNTGKTMEEAYPEAVEILAGILNRFKL